MQSSASGRKEGQSLCLVDNRPFFPASIEEFGMLKGVLRLPTSGDYMHQNASMGP